ncbi:MAG: hypothetical protein COA36_12635 [Desulfotalea sp.]|nr:MAG: hypothetical protein COA36_12635 [Desulfotalea sp.]
MIQKERTLLWLLCGILMAFFLWSILFKIDVAAMMVGEVVPAGQIKRIQHLEGGIVSKILVREGETVITGQPILELSSTRSDADVHELEVRMASLGVDVLRLQSLLHGVDVMELAPGTCVDDVGLENGLELFHTQRLNYLALVGEQRVTIDLRKVEKSAELGRITFLSPRLGFVNEQVKISEQLIKDGLTNRFEHIDLLKEANTIESNIASAKNNIVKIDVTLSREKARLKSLIHKQKEAWNRELAYARKQLNELQERLYQFVDSQKRTVVRAPVSGTVFKLFVNNPGSVIPPGGTVLTLVPAGDSFLIEAKMMISDIGYVHLGQKARLQLLADSSGGFQPIFGTVDYISADAVSEPQGQPYFLVRITPEKTSFSNGEQLYSLLPGVSIQAGVLTGKRTLFAYMINPLFHNLSSALSER